MEQVVEAHAVDDTRMVEAIVRSPNELFAVAASLVDHDLGGKFAADHERHKPGVLTFGVCTMPRRAKLAVRADDPFSIQQNLAGE